jgi:HlyD family secretion protein
MRREVRDSILETAAEIGLPPARPLAGSRRRALGETSQRREPRLVRRALLVVAALGLLAAVAYLALRPMSAEVFVLARRDITLSAHGVGTVEAKTVVDLSSKVSGRLLTVRVDEGDPIRRGDVLATVDAAELRAELDRAQATLARSRLAVTAQEASAERARSALAASYASAAKARAEGVLASKNADRWRRLHEQGVVAESERDARETEATVNAAALAAADAEAVAMRREIDAAIAALEMARNDVVAARAEEDAARARLGDTSIVSPVDGYVVRRLLEPGALATPGLPILRVADPTTAWVTIYLNETEAVSVAAGDAAEIVLRSSPSSPVPGRVARVRRESDRVTEQLAVDIAFDSIPERLVLGEQAEATISGAARRAVVAVPLSAVARSERGQIVLVVSGDRLAGTPVRLGLVGAGGLVEVVSGLEAGQMVVTNPGRLAEPGNEGRRIRPVRADAAQILEASP